MPDEDLIQVRRDDVQHIMSAAAVSELENDAREAAWERLVVAIATQPAEQAPLPAGEYARVEVMGHDQHTGWVTDGTRAGVPVLVVKDWDGHTIAEVPGGSLYRFVPLPTPLKRPEPQRSLAAWSAENLPADGDDDYDEMGPF